MTRFLLWLTGIILIGCVAIIGLAQVVGRMLPDAEIAYAARFGHSA